MVIDKTSSEISIGLVMRCFIGDVTLFLSFSLAEARDLLILVNILHAVIALDTSAKVYPFLLPSVMQEQITCLAKLIVVFFAEPSIADQHL